MGEELKVHGIMGGIVFLLARYISPGIAPMFLVAGTILNIGNIIEGKWQWQTFASLWFVVLFSTGFGILAGRRKAVA